MKLIETRILRGPNVYAYQPVMRLTLDLEQLEEWPSHTIPGFVDRLLQAVPSLHEHGCSYRRPGGFVTRMREGTWLGHILEHVALELQCLAGTPVTFGKTRSAKRHGVYHVVYRYVEEALGTRAGEIALATLRSLLPSNFPDWLPAERSLDEHLRELRELAASLAFGPSTKSLVDEAKRRGIPVTRLDDEGGLVQLGWGARQQRIQATVTGRTGYIAVDIAQDKLLTASILGRAGLPVPRHEKVDSADEAAAIAREKIGFPVVVKPMDLSKGRGVALDLRDEDAVRQAFAATRELTHAVLVEAQCPGKDHRVLVVNDRVIAVAERVPAHVVGDGQHTLRELVDAVNADPRRGEGHENVLTRIPLDETAQRRMERAGYTLDTVLAADEVFTLADTGNLSTGGTAVDRTDEIHADNALIAVRAARALGLDVAGIDLICPDISRSIHETGGAIVEVNAAPGFRMHLAPTAGEPRDVAGPVLDMLFPEGGSARIPIAAITGTNGKTTVSRMVARIVEESGRRVGLTTTDGIWIGGACVARGDMTGPWSARVVLGDPTVEVAVLETARGGILREGLAWDRCDVGCVLNVAADHLGLAGIDTIEELAELKRLLVEVVHKDGASVLNADDPLTRAMAGMAEGKIVYFSASGGRARVLEHLEAGGRAVVLEPSPRGEVLTLYEGHACAPLLAAAEIPATLQGKARFNVENALAAAAIAWSLGCSAEQIRAGLSGFTSSFAQSPGRCNVFEGHHFRVIVDYAHNAAAMTRMVELVAQLHRSQTIGVVACPGDRRDEDILELGRIAGGGFDVLIVKEDADLRGRAPGEVARLLREGAASAGMPREQVHERLAEEEAYALAVSMARPGDLIALFADEVEHACAMVMRGMAESNEKRMGLLRAAQTQTNETDAVLPLRKTG